MTDISVTSTVSAAARPKPVVRRKSSANHGRLPVLLIFLPPALLLFTIFVILPMGEAAWYSLYKWSGYGAPTDFVGLRNFQVLFNNQAFLTSLKNNALIIVVSIIVQIPLAIWLSTMLANRIAGVVMFRLIFFLPYVLAEVAAGLIWRFVYDGDYGLFASLAHLFGVATPYVLADKDLAIYAVLAVIVWKYFGFHMMLFIAGLQSLDKSILEAAEIDGATGWQKFRYVTLPLLASTLRLSVFFAIVGSLQLFDLIMPLTGGGPFNSTQTMVTFLFNFGVTRMQVGLGSAVGVVLFVICVTLAFGYKRIFMRND
ncbi:sugar ABC transporter permease [Rhizobium sp. VS19-DR104.2]|uniref:carbohydrate ABC transporter permease n=1 Tax=unclassified Rhizobium TaxID=2613769 RepID=UPI001AD97B7E|nr:MULTISPECIES: sugar ABC transporter permease [unclassified Rhizobium]MBO9101591.1 sugar ABC transporter permease [Rhizobium sp. L58/93]MBO9134748.1 sugar ABC transporter permease [Rhizobium sp. B209b/85]MBO9170571.1 sugar ABC transporter permease [Rhizobium sp. L245/93]MBO9187584.1 sugar ABC transporter permease [Rhizobium sp. E27B/91]MBZ5761299.1 sugar ABC transporter permease [Rhizobium sp. VS19-DR96]